jgi:hypothetical protein
MEIYRIPRREMSVRILLDDGRSLDGTLFTSDTGPGGRPVDLLHHLNDPSEDFVPLSNGSDRFLLNKAGIIWAQATGDAAEEIAAEAAGGHRVPVRLSLAGGVGLVGTLSIVMPPERSRVLDYLNAAGRFVPLFGEGTVTLVQRGFVVVVRTAEDASRD